ncbi:hypothetical protein AB0K87_34960, partial [Streptomyces sp. NPDC053705]
MRADRVFAYGAAAGLIGDLLLGDPRRGHPVAAFGRAATHAENLLWRDHRGCPVPDDVLDGHAADDGAEGSGEHFLGE